MVADCLEHYLAAWLAARCSVRFELVAKLVILGVELLKVAGQVAEPLLDLGLVRLPGVVSVMSLQVLGQVNSLLSKNKFIMHLAVYKCNSKSPRKGS